MEDKREKNFEDYFDFDIGYLKMEGWISYPDIDLFNVEEQIGKLNSNPLIKVE